MKITNPQPFVDQIDHSRWEQMKGRGSLRSDPGPSPKYVEPPVAAATKVVPKGSVPLKTEQEDLIIEHLGASGGDVADDNHNGQPRKHCLASGARWKAILPKSSS